MGGELGGKEASQAASTVINDVLQEVSNAKDHFTYTLPNNKQETIDLTRLRHDPIEVKKLLSYIQLKIKEKNLIGGATIAGIFEVWGTVFAFNCGDARVYKKTAAGLEQLTKDHSLVQRLVDIGQLTREEAEVHRQRNVVYRNFIERGEIDVQRVDLGAGESLVIVCDGVPGAFEETYSQNPQKMIGALDTALQGDDCAKTFVKAAIAQGGGTTDDNVSAIVIKPI